MEAWHSVQTEIMTSSENNKPRSMREFDYFDDDSEPLMGNGGDLAETGLEGQIEAFRRRQKRHFRYVLLTAATFFVCSSFLWGYRDHMAYVFASPHPPSPLGEITQMTPRDIPHNSYVTVSGITEHRGLTLEKVRGFGVSRDELWYFRLAGSRGVFIEVLPDKQSYGFATRVEVTGRAVDPQRESGYEQLFADYHRRFASQQRPALRVIQVGVAPGAGRGTYIVAFVVIMALFLSNIVVLVRLVRSRRTAGRMT